MVRPNIRPNHLKDRRIRVNAISPGSIDTPGLSDLLAFSEIGEQRKKTIFNNVPLGSFGTPDEIAKAVVFLASDDTSYITGTELFVDGGIAQCRPLPPFGSLRSSVSLFASRGAPKHRH